MKYVTVRIGEIIWCNESDDGELLDVSGLLTSIETFEVETDEDVDPYSEDYEWVEISLDEEATE